MAPIKVTKQQCRFAQDCIFLPLCLFVHSKEDKNDQEKALSRNMSGCSAQVEKCAEMQMVVEQEHQSDTNCSLTSMQCSPQISSGFPKIDFSTKFTFFNVEDFSSDFEILALDTNEGCYFFTYLPYV